MYHRLDLPKTKKRKKEKKGKENTNSFRCILRNDVVEIKKKKEKTRQYF